MEDGEEAIEAEGCPESYEGEEAQGGTACYQKRPACGLRAEHIDEPHQAESGDEGDAQKRHPQRGDDLVHIIQVA